MATKKNSLTQSAPIREVVEGRGQHAPREDAPHVRTHVVRRCKECRVGNAFHTGIPTHLPPAFNVGINLTNIVNIPAGQRAVIELVTATIEVPHGESARLRMFTSLGFAPSNLDLILTLQGHVGGRDFLVATHSVRVYSDHLIEFNVHRDNPVTEGDAFICISGYLIDV
jgi:hypothetical protein